MTMRWRVIDYRRHSYSFIAISLECTSLLCRLENKGFLVQNTWNSNVRSYNFWDWERKNGSHLDNTQTDHQQYTCMNIAINFLVLLKIYYNQNT